MGMLVSETNLAILIKEAIELIKTVVVKIKIIKSPIFTAFPFLDLCTAMLYEKNKNKSISMMKKKRPIIIHLI
ncbi:MAG: hypothetical protein FWG67_06650 [Defluviitaleaceae bacterium]|nr:hypothetical protein [Defluviitaleaceae bacterium]